MYMGMKRDLKPGDLVYYDYDVELDIGSDFAVYLILNSEETWDGFKIVYFNPRTLKIENCIVFTDESKSRWKKIDV